MANRKAKKAHKPPARIRYEQSHPTISFRLPMELREQLVNHLTQREITVADFIKEALGAKKIETPNIAKIRYEEYTQGYYEGFEDGYNCAEDGLPYPPNLKTRRDREKAIEYYQKTGKLPTEDLFQRLREHYGKLW